MTAGTAMVGVLLRRLLRLRRFLALSALTAAAGLITLIAGASVPADDLPVLYGELTIIITGVTVPIASLLVSSAALGEERNSDTFPYLYLKPVPRSLIAFAGWVAAFLGTLAVATAGWLVGFVGFGIYTGDWSFALPSWALIALAAVGYAAAFVPLGYLTRRAVIAGLGYIFVWEWILGAFITGLAPSSIWRTAVSGYASLRALPEDVEEVLAGVTAGLGGAMVKLVALVVLSIALMTAVLKRRDAL